MFFSSSFSIVNESELIAKNSENYERISELLDIIPSLHGTTTRILENVDNYFEYLLNNPLRKYVPPSKLFNGKTYKEYENEYTLYYRMLKGNHQ